MDDRAYINTLFGHQSEVLTIDCLRKERLLTVGRDRSMQLWKVDLVFDYLQFLAILSLDLPHFANLNLCSMLGFSYTCDSVTFLLLF